MSVYVDEARWPWRGKLWCHLVADTPDELFAAAKALGLKAHWVQKPGSFMHFDITERKRDEAVQRGAISISPQELVRRFAPLDRSLTASEEEEVS